MVKIWNQKIKCFIDNQTLRIYTKGGFWYLVAFHTEVLDVYPLENGIIVKLVSDPNLEKFSPLSLDLEPTIQYVSVIDHPYDHPAPLGFLSQKGVTNQD